MHLFILLCFAIDISPHTLHSNLESIQIAAASHNTLLAKKSKDRHGTNLLFVEPSLVELLILLGSHFTGSLLQSLHI